jgi:hypothetical protein
MWGWTILLGLLALAEGNNIVVEHSLTSNGEGPIYQTRGVIELGANSAAFKQEPLREADAVSLKVCQNPTGALRTGLRPPKGI